MTKQKLSTQPYKGARDFYPQDMRLRNYIFDTWKKVSKRYGYEEYDFPIIENFEVFASKTGEEIVNTQLYSFTDRGDRKVAIRPELTPSTVRMIAAKYQELQQPIRWFMIGNNWRFEKPQLGRGREFYQLEFNIFGIEDVTAELEVFSFIVDMMKEFGATQEMYGIRVSDRKLINALLIDTLKLNQESMTNVRRLMDKRNKLSKEDFFGALKDLGLDEFQCQKIEGFMDSTLENLSDVISPAILEQNKGYNDLIKLFKLLNTSKIDSFCKFDPGIIRGFDYSDGLVYELFDKNPNNKRSLFGGERFDRLINIFGDYDLPATGFAMGDYTTLEFLKNWNLIPQFECEIEYLVTLWPENSEKYLPITLETSSLLRQKKINTVCWLEDGSKLDKQLKYADKKGIKYAVIIGEEELETGTVTVKNLFTKEQIKKPFDQWLKELK